jgi:hypothetical protein
VKPGEETDAAWSEANRAAGLLALMVVKRRLSRDLLETAASLLEKAAARLRRALA